MKTIRQIAAIAVVSGVAVASLAGPAVASKSPAKNASTIDPSVAAAGYLVSHLEGKHHNHYTEAYAGTVYVEYGFTADGVLSMDAAGVGQKGAAKATAYLEKHVNDYALSYGGSAADGDFYPGSIAKLLLVAEAQHIDPEKFGGTDLTGDLVGTEGDGGGAPGQYVNPGDTTYSSSVINQSLALLALANAPHFIGPSVDAVNFLLGQQCADGSFQNDIRDDTTVACDPTKIDVDATSYAIQALENTNQGKAAKQAVKWLLSDEKSNGGWNETSGKADANSTAIAVEALISEGKAKAAAAGEAYLAKSQLGCTAPKGQRGGVISLGTEYKKATAIYATSQAGVALAGKDLAGISNKKAKSGAPALVCKK